MKNCLSRKNTALLIGGLTKLDFMAFSLENISRAIVVPKPKIGIRGPT